MPSKAPPNNEDVYLMFSDAVCVLVLFGILLVIVLIAMVTQSQAETTIAKNEATAANIAKGKAENEASAAKDAAGKAKREASDAKDAVGKKQKLIDRLSDDNENLINKLDKLDRKKIDILICHDCSGSMKPAIINVTNTLTSLASILPGVADDVRVGVLLYRGHKQDFSGMRPLVLPSEDKGKSLNATLDFIKTMPIETGEVNTHKAIEEAIKIQISETSEDRKQVIVMVTDAPWDESIKLNDPHTIDESIELVKRWRRYGTSKPKLVTYNPNPSRPEANDSLKRLGDAGGGGFAKSGSELLKMLGEAALSAN